MIAKNDDGPDIEFDGELVATTANPDIDISATKKTWTELNLYKTTDRKFVCETIGRTVIEGRTTKHSAVMVDKYIDAVHHFGDEWLARKLFSNYQR